MKRNLLLVVSALFVISLIIAVSSIAATRKGTQSKTPKSVEQMIKFCEKNPEMVKYMEKTLGKDWKNKHGDMSKMMKDGNCPMMDGEGGSMMGGKGMMGGTGGSMMGGTGGMMGGSSI